MKVEVKKTCVVTNQRITTDMARLPQMSTLIMMHKSPQQATRHKSWEWFEKFRNFSIQWALRFSN